MSTTLDILKNFIDADCASIVEDILKYTEECESRLLDIEHCKDFTVDHFRLIQIQYTYNLYSLYDKSYYDYLTWTCYFGELKFTTLFPYF